VFNELLVQYPWRGQRRPRQVVPDNMVVVCKEPIQAEGSYDTPLQSERPFWVLVYVSKYTKRKDYEEDFTRYEGELKVPYYLLFYPDKQELTPSCWSALPPGAKRPRSPPSCSGTARWSWASAGD
jgi:Uma2 family endonuclease